MSELNNLKPEVVGTLSEEETKEFNELRHRSEMAIFELGRQMLAFMTQCEPIREYQEVDKQMNKAIGALLNKYSIGEGVRFQISGDKLVVFNEAEEVPAPEEE